jgi:hypothetical protein
MMLAGIGMVSIGFIGLVAGIVTAVQGGSRVQVYGPGGYLKDRRADDGMKNGGIALGVISGVLAAAGIPVWAYGAHRVPLKKPAEEPQTEPSPKPPPPTAIVRVGPAGASVEVAF